MKASFGVSILSTNDLACNFWTGYYIMMVVKCRLIGITQELIPSQYWPLFDSQTWCQKCQNYPLKFSKTLSSENCNLPISQMIGPCILVSVDFRWVSST